MIESRAGDSASKAAVGAAVLLSAGAALNGGLTGFEFFMYPIEVPLWFVLALTIVPTGETLRTVRTIIRQQVPTED